MAGARGEGNPKKRLDDATWIKIQSRYERGESVRGMGREFGVNPASIVNKGKKLGWMGHGELKEQALDEARVEVKSLVKKSYVDEVKSAQSRHLDISRNVQKLGHKLMTIVSKNVDEDDPAKKKNINREIYQLNILAMTMRSGIDIERMSLGMENVKPDEEKDGFGKFVDAINDMRSGRAEREKNKTIDITPEVIEEANIKMIDITPEVTDE